MAFEIATAYGIMAVTASILGFMAVRNRRAGWVRERRNVILDVFLAWGRANAEMSKPFSAPAASRHPAPQSVRDQLFALHTALAANAGAKPVEISPAETIPVESTPIETMEAKSSAGQYAQYRKA